MASVGKGEDPETWNGNTHRARPPLRPWRWSTLSRHVTLRLPGEGAPLLASEASTSARSPVHAPLGPRNRCPFSSRPSPALPCRPQTCHGDPSSTHARRPGAHSDRRKSVRQKNGGAETRAVWAWRPGCSVGREGGRWRSIRPNPGGRAALQTGAAGFQASAGVRMCSLCNQLPQI